MQIARSDRDGKVSWRTSWRRNCKPQFYATATTDYMEVHKQRKRDSPFILPKKLLSMKTLEIYSIFVLFHNQGFTEY